MRKLLTSAVLASMAMVGCARESNPAGPGARKPDTTPTTTTERSYSDPNDKAGRPLTDSKRSPGNPAGVDRDNTAVNERDRANATKTPIDQNENKKDIDITARIRQGVVDTKMSTNAQNAKIITQNGKVTLRGPVKSQDEKMEIEQIATDVAGAGNVDNQLEVQP